VDTIVFDLAVKCRREFLLSGKDDSALAFKAGIISGLNLGIARLKASEEMPEWNMAHILGSNEVNIDQAIEKVNKLMPVGVFCNKLMFYLLEQRVNPQYERGFIDGFYYVFNLHSNFSDLFPRDQRDRRFAETMRIVEARKAEILQMFM